MPLICPFGIIAFEKTGQGARLEEFGFIVRVGKGNPTEDDKAFIMENFNSTVVQ